jgi:hypothetical protein
VSASQSVALVTISPIAACYKVMVPICSFLTLTLILSLGGSLGLPIYAVGKVSRLPLKVLEEAPIKIDQGQARRLVIIGFAGQVILGPNTRSAEVGVRVTKTFDDLRDVQPVVILKNMGDRVEVRAQLSPARADWDRWSLAKGIAQVPQVKLEILAPPSMSAEIYWKRGDVSVDRWNGYLWLVNQSGHHQLSHLNGGARVQTQFGRTTVEDATNGVIVETQSGQTRIVNCRGNIGARTFLGDVVIEEGQGVLRIDTVLGAVRVKRWSGDLKGKSVSGRVDAQVLGAPRVTLESQSGTLIARVSARAGYRAWLSSEKGVADAPQTLMSELKRVSLSSGGKRISGSVPSKSTQSAPSGELKTADGMVKLTSDIGQVALKVF